MSKNSIGRGQVYVCLKYLFGLCPSCLKQEIIEWSLCLWNISRIHQFMREGICTNFDYFPFSLPHFSHFRRSPKPQEQIFQGIGGLLKLGKERTLPMHHRLQYQPERHYCPLIFDCFARENTVVTLSRSIFSCSL